MNSEAAGGPRNNAVGIKEYGVALPKPFDWMVAPILLFDRCKTTSKWMLEDKPIIDARSGAHLRLLKIRRFSRCTLELEKNLICELSFHEVAKIELEKRFILSSHETANHGSTNLYFFQAQDPIIVIHFDHKIPRFFPSQTLASDAPASVDSLVHDSIEEHPSIFDIPGPTTRIGGAASISVSDVKIFFSPKRVGSAVDSVNDTVISLFLDTLFKFNNIVNEIDNVLPYAKAAWIILSAVSKTIINQVNLDNSIMFLLRKMNEVYTFLAGEDSWRIESMRTIVERIARQTIECAYFIREYSKNKEFRTRYIKNLISGTDDHVENFRGIFDKLMQEFRDNAARDTSVVVNHPGQGFFTASHRTQLLNCELNQVQGDQFTNTIYYVNAESKWTVLAWTQLLVLTPPGALIVGQGGYHYAQKLNHYLGDGAQSIVKAEPRNDIALHTSYYLHVRDVTGIVNVLVFFYLIFRKVVVRH